MRLYPSQQEGLTAILITFIVLSVGISLTISVVFVFLNRLESARNAGHSEQAFFAAEAGIEDALLRRFNSQMQLPVGSYTLTVGSSSTEITVDTSVPPQTIITSRGDSANRVREVEVTVADSTDNVSFFYGVQIGGGGLTMSNNSSIQGNVYSNGSVEGSNGTVITGSVIIAGDGTSENELEGVTVGGDVLAPSLKECSVGGDIAYINENGCTAGGTITQQSDAIPAETLPISDETINQWKQDAEEAGVIAGGDFEPAKDAAVTIGPGVINGDMLLTNNQTITIAGLVYVKGNIDIDNGASVQLSSSFGSHSGVIITDGWVSVKNNGVFSGSGDPNSYLMFLTTLACDGTGGGGLDCADHSSAIDLHNNADGAIFYAGNGMINIHNNIQVTQTTAWRLSLGNNTEVNYELGLENALFSEGPGASRSVEKWQEK